MRISDWSSDVCSSDLFSRRAGFGLAWVGLEVLGIAAFAGPSLLLGWLLLPDLATPRLPLAIIVAAIVKARLSLPIVRFIIAPARPALALAPTPAGAARPGGIWVPAPVQGGAEEGPGGKG